MQGSDQLQNEHNGANHSYLEVNTAETAQNQISLV